MTIELWRVSSTSASNLILNNGVKDSDTHIFTRRFFMGNLQVFDIKEFVNRGNGHAGTQTLITPKGRETFRLLMEAEGLIGMSDDTEDM